MPSICQYQDVNTVLHISLHNYHLKSQNFLTLLKQLHQFDQLDKQNVSIHHQRTFTLSEVQDMHKLELIQIWHQTQQFQPPLYSLRKMLSVINAICSFFGIFKDDFPKNYHTLIPVKKGYDTHNKDSYNFTNTIK